MRLTGRRAGQKIEPEAQFLQQLQLEAQHQFAGRGLVRQVIQKNGQAVIELGMGIAFRQKPDMSGGELHAGQSERGFHQPAGPRKQRLQDIGAHMLVQPCAPIGRDEIAGLQDRLHATRTPAAHEAEMPAPPTGHQLCDDARLAMATNAENDRFLVPFHGV